MKRFLVLALGTTALASASFAGTYFYQGQLNANSPTYTNPNGNTGGGQAYSVFQFSVTAAGAYTIEMASPNTAPAGSSNALDTFVAIYTGSFNPPTPGAATAFSDDFTGLLTVLPGPYSGTVGPSGTGWTGAQPASRIAAVNLTTGVDYFIINTSFWASTFVGTGTQGSGLGDFYTGISGPGDIVPVPEPATLAALGLGAVALLRRRKKA